MFKFFHFWYYAGLGKYSYLPAPAYIIATIIELFLIFRLLNLLKSKKAKLAAHFLLQLCLGTLLISMYLYSKVFAVNLNFSILLFANNVGEISKSILELLEIKHLSVFTLDLLFFASCKMTSQKAKPKLSIGGILALPRSKFYGLMALLFLFWYVFASPMGDLFEPFRRNEMEAVITFTPTGYFAKEVVQGIIYSVNKPVLTEQQRILINDFLDNRKGKVGNEIDLNFVSGPLDFKPNIVIIQFESLMAEFIDKKQNGREILPFLNAISKKALIARNFYSHAIATSDSDFSTLVSLLPHEKKIAHFSFFKNEFSSLPKTLKKYGYFCAYGNSAPASFWNTESFNKKIGFDYQFFKKNLPNEDLIHGWLNDKRFFHETFEKVKKMQQPFFLMVLTISSHHPFKDKNLPVFFKIANATDQEIELNNYINSIHYTDSALADFFENFSKLPIFSKTIFVIYGDHSFPLGYQMNLLRKDFGNLPDSEKLIRFLNNRVPCIFYAPGFIKSGIIDRYSGQIDIAPTLLDLCGIETPRLFLGQSLLRKAPGQAFHKFFLGMNESKLFYSRRYGSKNFRHVFSKDSLKKSVSDARVLAAFKLGSISEMILEYNFH